MKLNPNQRNQIKEHKNEQIKEYKNETRGKSHKQTLSKPQRTKTQTKRNLQFSKKVCRCVLTWYTPSQTCATCRFLILCCYTGAQTIKQHPEENLFIVLAFLLTFGIRCLLWVTVKGKGSAPQNEGVARWLLDSCQRISYSQRRTIVCPSTRNNGESTKTTFKLNLTLIAGLLQCCVVVAAVKQWKMAKIMQISRLKTLRNVWYQEKIIYSCRECSICQ